MMLFERNGRWREAAKLALLSFLITPLTILIHELGHFAVPVCFDLPAKLHPTRVSGGAVLGEAPSWMAALQAGGGPLATFAMGLAAAYLYDRRRRLWALAFAVAAVSRFVVTTAYLGLRLVLFALGRPFPGNPNFDEHNFARAVGIGTELAALGATLFLACLLVWLMRRVEHGRRMLFMLAMAIPIVIANIAWARFAPPVLATVG